MQSRCLVIVPTYNEVFNITMLVRSIIKTDSRVDVLIVDDSSPDGTAQVIRTEFLNEKRVSILSRKHKMGIGSAYLDGFKWAIDRGYDYVMEMDADFSHRPETIPSFLDNIQDCDLVLGSRYIKGGKVENWALWRELMSKWALFYARMFLGLPIKDMTSGFKCFKTEVLKKLDLEKISSSGYSFQIEMTYLVQKLGRKIKEIPIAFVDTRVGRSKLGRRDMFKAFLLVPYLAAMGKRHPALKR